MRLAKNRDRRAERAQRRPAQRRAKTLAIVRSYPSDFERVHLEVLDEYDRPRLRGDCIDGPRPCPWVGCQYHLYLDVADNGSIKLNFPDREVDELTETCALDVATHGGEALEDVGVIMNLTRERVRQVEMTALLRVRRRLRPACGWDYGT